MDLDLRRWDGTPVLSLPWLAAERIGENKRLLREQRERLASDASSAAALGGEGTFADLLQRSWSTAIAEGYFGEDQELPEDL